MYVWGMVFFVAAASAELKVPAPSGMKPVDNPAAHALCDRALWCVTADDWIVAASSERTVASTGVSPAMLARRVAAENATEPPPTSVETGTVVAGFSTGAFVVRIDGDARAHVNVWLPARSERVTVRAEGPAAGAPQILERVLDSVKRASGTQKVLQVSHAVQTADRCERRVEAIADVDCDLKRVDDHLVRTCGDEVATLRFAADACAPAADGAALAADVARFRGCLGDNNDIDPNVLPYCACVVTAEAELQERIANAADLAAAAVDRCQYAISGEGLSAEQRARYKEASSEERRTAASSGSPFRLLVLVVVAAIALLTKLVRSARKDPPTAGSSS